MCLSIFEWPASCLQFRMLLTVFEELFTNALPIIWSRLFEPSRHIYFHTDTAAHLPEHIFIWPNSHCMTRSHWRSLQSEKHQMAGREDKSGELQSSTRDLSVCSCLAVGWIDFVRRVNSKMFCVRLPSPCDRCDSDESDPKEMMLRDADLKNYSNGPLSLCSLPLIDRHWFERYFIYLKIWILLKNIIYLPPYFGRSLKNEYIIWSIRIILQIMF